MFNQRRADFPRAIPHNNGYGSRIRMKIEPLGDWRRTHTCGALRASDNGADVCLMGWVNRSRDHGGVIFIDLRDRYGVTQVVFDPADVSEEVFKLGDSLHIEFVVAIRGRVRMRPGDMANPKLPTGEIEVLASEAKILAASEPPPIPVNEEGDEDERVRLRHRFLELRRERMQRNLAFRSDMNRFVRNYFADRGFLELETPVLTRSTPEGARDFLVPSRLIPGSLYALPQSPQLFKQTFMACGFDKYMQIVKCFRDEDLRADRQPEHTQIDFEMSFVTQEQIFELVEGMISSMLKQGCAVDAPAPFPRMTYRQAMDLYGSDKPDTRYGFEITDITDAIKGSDFKVFEGVIAKGGRIRGINVKGGEALSRKDIDDLIEYSKKLGSTGLAWMRVTPEGLKSNIVKFFNEQIQQNLIDVFKAEPGDLLTFVAGPAEEIAPILGDVRLYIIGKLKPEPSARFSCLWVTDFPMFEWDPERKGWAPMHHIFTMPREEHIDLLESDPGAVLGQLYDLVINGVEIGSGSLRINTPELQKRVFNVIGIDDQEAEKRFGFLLEVFRYGAPPHGGMGLGLDRLIMLMLGERSIRDVIPFPKTATGSCLMTGAPAEVDRKQLREVYIKLDLPDEV
jgi:aspartyl-tRNA synthetase